MGRVKFVGVLISFDSSPASPTVTFAMKRPHSKGEAVSLLSLGIHGIP